MKCESEQLNYHYLLRTPLRYHLNMNTRNFSTNWHDIGDRRRRHSERTWWAGVIEVYCEKSTINLLRRMRLPGRPFLSFSLILSVLIFFDIYDIYMSVPFLNPVRQAWVRFIQLPKCILNGFIGFAVTSYPSLTYNFIWRYTIFLTYQQFHFELTQNGTNADDPFIVFDRSSVAQVSVGFPITKSYPTLEQKTVGTRTTIMQTIWATRTLLTMVTTAWHQALVAIA